MEAQGRIEEAFVLAELLHAEEEAVALLERWGLWVAAELAEWRNLPPEIVTRG